MNVISHETISKYLLSHYNDEVTVDPSDILSQDPIFDGLVRILERTASDITVADLTPETAYKELSMSEIEDVILSIYSGDYDRRETVNLLSGIVHCPRTYGKVYMKLSQIYVMANPGPVPSEVQAMIKDPEYFLGKIGAGEEVVAASEPVIVELSTPSSSLTKRIRGPLLTIAALIALGFGIKASLFSPVTNNPAREFTASVHNNSLEIYDPSKSTLRGRRGNSDARPKNIRDFSNQYGTAFGYYLTREFEKAIELLEPLAMDAERILATHEDSASIHMTRDAWLILGLSYLNASQKENLPSETKAENLANAVHYIIKAKNSNVSNELQTDDAEVFFLGLAYYFQGKPGLAATQFSQIEEHSHFYNKSQEMLRIL